MNVTDARRIIQRALADPAGTPGTDLAEAVNTLGVRLGEDRLLAEKGARILFTFYPDMRQEVELVMYGEGGDAGATWEAEAAEMAAPFEWPEIEQRPRPPGASPSPVSVPPRSAAGPEFRPMPEGTLTRDQLLGRGFIGAAASEPGVEGSAGGANWDDPRTTPDGEPVTGADDYPDQGGALIGYRNLTGGEAGHRQRERERSQLIPASLRNEFIATAQMAGWTVEEVDQRIRELAQQVVTQATGGQQFMSVPGMPPIPMGGDAQDPTRPSRPNTLEEMVRSQIAQLEGVITDTRGGILAPGGYFAESERVSVPRLRSGGYWEDTPMKPVFREQDVQTPGFMDPAQIKSIQMQMVEAGLLDEAQATGMWLEDSMAAYRTVLGYANQQGYTDVNRAMREMIRLGQEAADSIDRQPFVNMRVFVAPDYASLAQEAKAYARSRIGREPTEAEMATLTAAMSSTYRSQYEAQVAADRAQYEAAQALEQDPDAQINMPTIQGVDPAARFREMFDERFRPEIDRLEDLDSIAFNQDNVMASITTMGNMIQP